jgi:molybdenum ABC transporter ATP-binding protein
LDALTLDLRLPLRSFALEVALEVDGVVALVGPSGAGKTSVLRSIAGLVRPERGRITLGQRVWLDSERGVALPPERRSVGLVFQDYALFPHLSVRRNVAYGAGGGLDGLLERFGIAHLADARPGELSGGERQRVALARALAREPDVLLLDEPLAALDAHTRTSVRAELQALLRDLGLPTLLVTHDFEDAAALAARIGVLVDGRLLQLGTAQELVSAPADPFVASFTGANLLRGTARRTGDGLTRVELDGAVLYSTDEGEGAVGVVVHPWEVVLSRAEPLDSSMNHVRGPVRSVVPVGNRVRVRVGELTAEVTAASVERLEIAPGVELVASFKAAGTRIVPLR